MIASAKVSIVAQHCYNMSKIYRLWNETENLKHL